MPTPTRRRRSKRTYTPYHMGARFEQTVRDAIERAGGWRTLRSAGSHDAVDILAWRLGSGRVLAIQCKRDGAISAHERDAVLEFAGGLANEFYVARSHHRALELRDCRHWATEDWRSLAEVV